MTISDLVDKFQYYAQTHVDLLHVKDSAIAFLHLEAEELQVAIKNNLKFPCLLLQTPEVEKSSAYDSVSEDWSFTYVVLLPLGNQTKAFISDRCKTISDDIFNRLMADVRAGFIPGIVPGTNEGIVGPLTDQIYGWGKSLSISDGFDATVNIQKWTDEGVIPRPGNGFPLQLD